ncbi:acetyltransferase [Erythrobacter sp. SG61-1L]|uniref:GNAT family N-acetyltransferase n=1 Tax=Erythrobacter sp. SG61-1L TaxID=1603897 RepID=UPI0006C90C79|nr:GNAT family protein [Erythrobacter sp. SG61-1L]KPL69418.1 acetyltransferase [Erythrobacter sp. SG61-1L]
MTVIRTERLILRPAAESDVDGMHAILSDPRAMAYWSSLPHSSVETTRKWLAAMIATRPEEGEDFIIEHDGRAIGKAGFHRFPAIGYVLHPACWGQGFAQEALRPVIERGFTRHLLARIVADVDPRNEGSLKLLRRLGFAEAGYREKSWYIGGEWLDSVDMALEARDWAAAT